MKSGVWEFGRTQGAVSVSIDSPAAEFTVHHVRLCGRLTSAGESIFPFGTPSWEQKRGFVMHLVVAKTTRPSPSPLLS